MALASYVRKYFWDIDPRTAKPKSHPEYYIKRILELGDRQAFEWLKQVFGLELIKKVVKKSRLSPKAKNYWKLTLNV